MSTIRIIKSEIYPSLRDYYKIDGDLSLKAKGLMTQLLSYESVKEFFLKDIEFYNKDSEDSIRTAIRELEYAGYLERYQGRDSLGKMLPVEYTVFENPFEGVGIPDIDEDDEYTTMEGEYPTSQQDSLQRLLDLTADMLAEVKNMYGN